MAMRGAGPTGYDIITLVIALLGVALGAASLTWNIAAHRLSGPVVKVELRLGARRPDAVVSTRGVEPPDLEMLIGQGFTEPIVGVEVTNDGRARTEIQDVTCRLSNGIGFFMHQYPGNPTLSYRLEGGASETWWVPALAIRDIAAASAAGQNLTACLEVRVTGPRTLRTKSFAL
jgi:hypothetical protein